MPFDNLRNTKIERLSLPLLTLFTFLSLVFAVFIPLFGVAGVIFLPVPVTLLVLSGRVRDSIICAVIACAIFVYFDYVMAPIIAILIVVISFIYKNSIRKDKRKLYTIACIFLSFCGALLLYFIITSLVNKVNYISEVVKNYNAYIDQVFSSEFILKYSDLMPVDRSQLEIILNQTRDILKFIIYIIPGILISLIALVSFMNYIATNAVLIRYGFNIKPFESFKNWDIPWYYCWGVITGLILILIPYGGQNLNKILDIAGFNLLAVFCPLYLILGISVLWGVMDKFKVSLIWRIIIFLLLSLFLSFTVLILSFIGLIDIWFNFRRLERKQLA